MFYKNYHTLLNKLNIDYFLKLDVSDIVNEIKKEPVFKKSQEHQTWFDISNGILQTDEIIPDDQDDCFPMENDYQVLKFFSREKNFKTNTVLNNYFDEINSVLLKFPEVEYVHLHSMKNFCIESHTDGNMVLIVNLIYPNTVNTDLFGLQIDQQLIIPSYKDIWLETILDHSAWNFTNQEWKFLAISIDRQYLG
jgi:hypothetical protein